MGVGMDYGLRATILHDYKPDAVLSFLNTLKDKTICHLKDTFQCYYSILRLPERISIISIFIIEFPAL